MTSIPTDDVHEAAARWFVRLQDCEDERLWEEHLDWLMADPAHAEAYAQVESLWIAAEDLPPRPEVAPVPSVATPAAPVVSLDEARARRAQARSWLRPAMGLAAAAAVAVFAVPQIARLIAPAGETYRTGGEGIRVVALADGSHLTLNRNSEVTVRLEDHRRTATLAAGEVLFDVHHEPTRPFTVTAAGRDVRVLGTEFDVIDQAGTFSVAVRRGLVSVSPTGAGGVATRLSAGTALVRAPGERTDRVERIDPDEPMAWEHGQLVFSDKPIEAVARDLSRYMGGPIAVAPALRGMKVSAVFRIADHARMRREVEAALPVRLESSGGRLTLVPGR